MFGGVPGLFKNFSACKIVAEGYTTEEQKPWVVVTKVIDDESDIYVYYNPCRQEDLEQAESEGWKPLK